MDEYAAAVAREERNRLLAHLHEGLPLMGLRAVTITWRHAMELSLAGNAFFANREPTRDEVQAVLWRLNPAFRRPDGHLPNLDSLAVERGAKVPSRLTSRIEKLRCYIRSRDLPPNLSEKFIRLRLEDCFQDTPATPETKEVVSPLLAVPSWFDFFANWFGRFGHDRGAVYDYGIAYSLQMLRAHAISQGRAAEYIPPSAKLYKPQG